MTAKKENKDDGKEDPKEDQRDRARRGWQEARAFLKSCRDWEIRSEEVKMIPIT